MRMHDDVLFDPENVASERPTALVPTIRWWEALRAPEVAEGTRSIGMIGMLQMEEVSGQCGRF